MIPMISFYFCRNCVDLRMDDFAEISYKGYRFIISKNPVNKTINYYVKELRKRNVGVVVRACKPSYDTNLLFKHGIKVHDLTIEDGASPSEEMLNIFFDIVKKQFYDNPEGAVAIHCVAGWCYTFLGVFSMIRYHKTIICKLYSPNEILSYV